MSVFTTVSPEQLERWLEGYSIGAVRDLAGIPAGIENTNYFLTTERQRYVLTLFEKLDAGDLPYFIELMAHLARHGIPCPVPVVNRDQQYLGVLCGKPACIVSRLEGASVLEPTADHCAQVGAMLAAMHLAGRSYPGQMANPRGPRWWRTTADQVMPLLAPTEALLLQQELRFQTSHRCEGLPRGVIHGDLFRDNVLFHDGTLSGVIDFYFACDEVWLYDLAIAVNDWCVGSASHGALDPELARTMLLAYHRTRSLSDAEHAAWPLMLRAAALRFWLSRLHELHFPRPGELTFAKDPGHFYRILQDHVAHHDGLQQDWI